METRRGVAAMTVLRSARLVSIASILLLSSSFAPKLKSTSPMVHQLATRTEGDELERSGSSCALASAVGAQSRPRGEQDDDRKDRRRVELDDRRPSNQTAAAMAPQRPRAAIVARFSTRRSDEISLARESLVGWESDHRR